MPRMPLIENNSNVITVQMTLGEASALVAAHDRSTEQTEESRWAINRIGAAWREAVEARAAENDEAAATKKEGPDIFQLMREFKELNPGYKPTGGYTSPSKNNKKK